MSADVVDARDLSLFKDGLFSHSFTHFAIMMDDTDSAKVASEIFRTLQPGGTASVTTWKQSVTALTDRVTRRIRPHVEPPEVLPKVWETKEHAGAALNMPIHQLHIQKISV